MPQSGNVILEVHSLEVGVNAPRCQALAELPQGHAGQLSGLADRESPLGMQAERDLDLQLRRGQARRIQDV